MLQYHCSWQFSCNLGRACLPKNNDSRAVAIRWTYIWQRHILFMKTFTAVVLESNGMLERILHEG